MVVHDALMQLVSTKIGRESNNHRKACRHSNLFTELNYVTEAPGGHVYGILDLYATKVPDRSSNPNELSKTRRDIYIFPGPPVNANEHLKGHKN